MLMLVSSLGLSGCVDSLRSEVRPPKWTAGFWYWHGYGAEAAPAKAVPDAVFFHAGAIWRRDEFRLNVGGARENRYDEAAQIYQSIHAVRRAPRMRQLAALYREANRTDLAAPQLQEARYRLAEFIGTNPNRIYYNDQWSGLQGYALRASSDGRLTREERETLMAGERKLKDDQEERWRGYLILREVVKDSGKTELGRRAAQLAIRCLRGISGRFGRRDEIRTADIELSNWLRH